MIMTKLNGRASVSIFQIVFFTPALFASILLSVKHGFGRSSGWVFLSLVSLFRIAGAATQLRTYSDASEGVFITSTILGSFGLSALLLASSGLLARTAESINRDGHGLLNAAHFRIVQLTALIGVILSIVGGTNINSNSQNESIHIPTELIAGLLIFVGTWILICIIAAAVIKSISYVAEGDRGLAWAVTACLPVLLIRLVYAVLTVFFNNKDFNLIFPSTVVLWTLSTIEECFVIVIYLVVGFNTEKVALRQNPPVQQGDTDEASAGTSLMR